jgi:hypothetical protein
MKTPILMLIAAFLIAACGGPAPYSPAGTPENPVVAGFSTSEAGTVDVQVTDRQPLTRAELASPDGQVFLAHQIEREQVRRSGGYGGQPSMGVGVGVGGGSSGGVGVGTGIGIGFPLGVGGDSGAPRDPRIASIARIRVPDMAAYRSGWQQWKVRVTLGEGAAQRVIEVEAPPPPAG